MIMCNVIKKVEKIESMLKSRQHFHLVENHVIDIDVINNIDNLRF